MNNYQFQKEEPQITTQKNNKTTLVLLILIIIAAITLGVLLATQNNENTTSTTDQSTTQTDTTPVEPEPPLGMRPGDIPVPEVIVTQEQLATNSNEDSCWTIIDGVVYDVTESIRRGRRLFGDISEICGKDGTQLIKEGVDGRPPLAEAGIINLYALPMGRIN